MSTETLPKELLWAEGGHASDVVLTALADGQDAIVPAEARAHVTTCAQCTRQLGNAALLSIYTGSELATLRADGLARATAEAAAKRQPLPRLAIALGLAVAALGAVPSLVSPSPGDSVLTLATQDAPFFLRGVRLIGERVLAPGSSSGLVLTYGTAALLVAVAVAVVRWLPKKETSQ